MMEEKVLLPNITYVRYVTNSKFTIHFVVYLNTYIFYQLIYVSSQYIIVGSAVA